MDLIRPFQRDDIPAVVELFRWAFHRNGDDASVALEPYFEHVFFENPWYDEELPSFVHVADSGGIDGFVGVQPKRLRFRGRRVRVIAATKLMASPTATPLVASRLVRRVRHLAPRAIGCRPPRGAISRLARRSSVATWRHYVGRLVNDP